MRTNPGCGKLRCPRCEADCPCVDHDEVDNGIGIQTGNHTYLCKIHGEFCYEGAGQYIFRDDPPAYEPTGKLESSIPPMSLTDQLTILLNKFSRESESSTPDFILAEYMESCLRAFEKGVKARDKWLRVDPMPDVAPEPPPTLPKVIVPSVPRIFDDSIDADTVTDP